MKQKEWKVVDVTRMCHRNETSDNLENVLNQLDDEGYSVYRVFLEPDIRVVAHLKKTNEMLPLPPMPTPSFAERTDMEGDPIPRDEPLN